MRVSRALISVSFKEGIVEFAKRLSEMGVEILATGKTSKLLKSAYVNVLEVSDVTGFPELLNGRVKTLHPKIHAGILANRKREEHLKELEIHDIKPIDMIVVNLYPFEETVKKEKVSLEEAVENIEYISLDSCFGSGDDIFALEVSGDSMVGDDICEGDYVICRRASVANDGQLVIAIVDNENATLKRFYNEKHQARLQPANDDYQPIYSENCRIEAVVIGLVRKL